MGAVASGAPVGARRTAAGEASPVLLVPVSLALCAAAKYAVDSGLTEERGFYPALCGTLALVYFGLTPLLYRYDGDYADLQRRVLSPKPRGHGRLRQGAGSRGETTEAMAASGGRDLLALAREQQLAAGAAGGGGGGGASRRTSGAIGQRHDPEEYYRTGRYVPAKTRGQAREEEEAAERRRRGRP